MLLRRGQRSEEDEDELDDDREELEVDPDDEELEVEEPFGEIFFSRRPSEDESSLFAFDWVLRAFGAIFDSLRLPFESADSSSSTSVGRLVLRSLGAILLSLWLPCESCELSSRFFAGDAFLFCLAETFKCGS